MGLTSDLFCTSVEQLCRFLFKKFRLVAALTVLSTCLFHDRSEPNVINSEVLSIFDCLKFSAMDVVFVDEGIPFVGDPYNLTLFRVKLHEPVPSQLLKFLKIFFLLSFPAVCV